MKIISRLLKLFKRVNYTVANIIDLSSNNLLEGKTALITCETSGIGYAIAEAFLKSGAVVTIMGRSSDRINRSLKELSCFKDRIYGIAMV